MVGKLAISFALVVATAAMASGQAAPLDAAHRPAAPSARGPANLPAPEDAIHLLSTGDWKERQAGVERLVALGAAAQPLLDDLLHRNLDRETRKNVELALEQIHQNRLLGPSLITLHVKDATPAQVFAIISRQSFAPLPTWPQSLWQEPGWAKLTLDYDRQPFWKVITELSRRLELDCFSPDPQEVRIARDSGHLPGGVSIDAAYLVTADAMLFRNGMNVELSVFGEPKITITRAVSFTIEQAIADQGNPLLPQSSRKLFFGRRFKAGSRQLPAPFHRPPDQVRRIARFKGSIRVAVETASDAWQIPDPVGMAAVTGLVDSTPVTLTSFTIAPGGDGFELRLCIPPAWSTRGGQDEVMDLVRRRLKVLDSQGRPLALGILATRGGVDGAGIVATYTSANTNANAAKDPSPARLVWEVPVRTREVTVPFDFKDLPINEPYD